MSADHPLFGKMFVCDGRLVTVGESYEDGNDPPGYYYRVEGEKQAHWISAKAVPVRFVNLHETAHAAGDELRAAGYRYDPACYGQWINDAGEYAKIGIMPASEIMRAVDAGESPRKGIIDDMYYVRYFGKA